MKTMRNKVIALFLGGLTAISLGWSSTAVAQQEEPEAEGDSALVLPSLQLQRFRPAPGPADYLTVFGTGISPHMEWNAGSFFNYSDDPLQLGALNTPERRTVTHQSQLDVVGAIGLWDMVEVGLVIPWTILQGSDELAPILPPEMGSRSDLPRTALNDWRVTGKYRFLDFEHSPVALALMAGVSLPIGNSNAFGGDGGFGAETAVVAEYILLETIRTAANLGFRYRPGQRILRQNVIGNEMTWGLAAHAPFLTDNLDVLAELAGALGVERKPERFSGIAPGEVPVELKGALRYRFFEDWAVTGGMGAGLTDGVGTPDWRFFIGVNGQWVTGGWWHVDYSQPGFRAEMDPCDDRLTDQTGRRLRFNPPDCPELDPEPVISHEDRVAILERAAPPALRRRPPAPPPVADDDDGDGGGASLRQGMIFITEQVNFGLGSADIMEDSYSVLNDVVRLLRRHDDIRLIRIEGHTDSVGRASNNLRLSRQRAESVRQYLIDGGIEPHRVEAIGYGQSQPIADNSTQEGRAENRRVEFNILEMGSGESR